MQYITTLADLNLSNTWVTIGSFDGVHRGHQAIIESMVKSAHASGGLAAVITFHPHPSVVLSKNPYPFYLTSPQERAFIFDNLGVDVTVTLTFTRLLAEISAREFLQLLAARLGLAHLWVGEDFALGRNREGTVPVLRKIGETLGFSVDVFPPVLQKSGKISSSQVRTLLSQGAVDQAALLLGRWYDIKGKVVEGEQRGQTLGFPTANLEIWQERLTPRNGVYATWAYFSGQRLPSVTNIGTRPTFQDPPLVSRVETHILDYTGDLYGAEICLDFIQPIRQEIKFPSPDALVEQINKDILTAREVLAHAPKTPGLPA
jgi:riboflavin kinase/FMN adenylyltransferase